MNEKIKIISLLNEGTFPFSFIFLFSFILFYLITTFLPFTMFTPRCSLLMR